MPRLPQCAPAYKKSVGRLTRDSEQPRDHVLSQGTVVEASLRAATDPTPSEWVEMCFRAFVEQSERTGMSLVDISRDLLRRSIELLSEQCLAAMYLDPALSRSMISQTMRYVADQLDAEPVERPRLQ